jgi:hypothetical protein
LSELEVPLICLATACVSACRDRRYNYLINKARAPSHDVKELNFHPVPTGFPKRTSVPPISHTDHIAFKYRHNFFSLAFTQAMHPLASSIFANHMAVELPWESSLAGHLEMPGSSIHSTKHSVMEEPPPVNFSRSPCLKRGFLTR